jgi:hypothetical protein
MLDILMTLAGMGLMYYAGYRTASLAVGREYATELRELRAKAQRDERTNQVASLHARLYVPPACREAKA